MLIKKILFPLFSLFLLYRSIELVKQVLATQQGVYSADQSFTIAFLLVLFITGIFAFPGFVFPTHNILPESYYHIKNPNALNKVYRGLGIKYFRVLLLVFFWGHKKTRKKYFDGTRSGLQNFVYQSKQSEFGHMAALVLIGVLNLVLLVKGYVVLALMLLAINVFGNLYPVLLQRYHRIRINRIMPAGLSSPVSE